MTTFGDAYNANPNSPESRLFMAELENDAYREAVLLICGKEEYVRISRQASELRKEAFRRHGIVEKFRTDDIQP